MSTDTDRIVNFCQSFHQFWSLPFQIGVSLYLLEQQVRFYTQCKVVTDHNCAGSDLKLPCFSFSPTFVWKAGEDPGNTGWHQAWCGQFLKMHVHVLIVYAQLMCCWLMLSYYLVCCDSIVSFPGSPRAQTKIPLLLLLFRTGSKRWKAGRGLRMRLVILVDLWILGRILASYPVHKWPGNESRRIYVTLLCQSLELNQEIY